MNEWFCLPNLLFSSISLVSFQLLRVLQYSVTFRQKKSDTGNNGQDECRNHRKQEAEKEIRYNGRSVSRKRREGRVSSPEEKRHVSFTRR